MTFVVPAHYVRPKARYDRWLATTSLKTLNRVVISLGLAVNPMAVAVAQDMLPTGGAIVSGQASIAQPNATSLIVTQTSDRAIVDWKSFSIGAGAGVSFIQPSSTSAILNRVTGSTTSTIAGSIQANGQVFLVNPNGISITSSGAISAPGFVASSLDIADDDFMAGRLKFTGNGSSADVTNEGTIVSGRGGFAALLGGSVTNAGTLSTELGRVGLGSGEAITLDLEGDGFMQVAVPSAGKSGALVTNSGRIRATGGRVELRAATARDVVRNVVNMTGSISARSVGTRGGAIVIDGGAGGAVRVSGRVAARGRKLASGGSVKIHGAKVELYGAKISVASSGGKGGSVAVTGKDIELRGTQVDASGAAGGGKIEIGGSAHGAGSLLHADTLTMDATSTVVANATQSGAGGEIVLWSDLFTDVGGSLSARGGASGGDGGFIETSSKGVLLTQDSLVVDASAPVGRGGLWLLDPQDLVINAAGAATISAALDSGTSVTATTSACNAAYGTCSGTLGNITLSGSIAKTAGGAASLTLMADRAITINGSITSTSSALDVTLIAAGAGIGTNSSSRFDLNGGLLTFQAAAGANQFGTITGSGGVTYSMNGTTFVYGNNSYTGPTTITVGRVSAAHTNALSSLSTLTVNAGALFDVRTSRVAIGGLSGAGSVFTYNSAPVTLVTGANGESTTFTGSIYNASSVVSIEKVGTGTLTLTKPLAHTGLTTVSEGTLQLTGAGRLSAGDISVASGATLLFYTTGYQGGTTFGRNLSGDGTVEVAGPSATNTVRFAGDNSGFTGLIKVDAGSSLSLEAATSGSAAAAFQVDGLLVTKVTGGSFQFGSLAGSGVITQASGTTNTVLEVGGNDQSTTYSGQIGSGSESISLRKVGGGTLTLSGANAYTGATTIDAGELTLAGSWNVGSGSAILVNNGALNGAGAITAGTLALRGAGATSLTGANHVGALSTTGTIGALSFNNAQALSVGAIDSSGDVQITTTSGNLTLQGIVNAASAGGSVVLAAGDSSSAGIVTGGDIVIGSGGGVTYGAGGQARLYTGSITGSTGVAALAPAGAYRYGSTRSVTNFTSALGAGTGVVYRAQPTLTIGSTSRVYDGATGSLAAIQLSGAANGDTPALTTTRTARDAGAYAFTAADFTNGLGYVLAGSGTYTISPKALTVSGVTASNKIYDGTSAAILSTSGVTLAGLVGSDDVTLSASGAFQTANAGAGKTVTISNLSLGGAAAGNYVLAASGQQASTTADISAKSLTVSGVTASNKIYDGTTAATLSTSGVTLSGLVGGDVVTLGASGAFQNANVGAGKTVTISNLSLGGAAAGNYLLAASGHQATTTADISAKTLTLAADANQGKIYGSADPALTYSVSGFVSGDTSSLLTGALNRAAGENVGAYTIGQGTISAGGNYAISYTGADFTITPKALTVSGVTASNKTYDGTTAAILSTSGVTLAGLVGSDDVTLSASGAFQNANAGSGKTVTISNLSLGGAAAGNYLLAASGQQATTTADISAKTLTLAADANQGKIYGSADPALTYSVSGFVSGDTSSLLTGALNRAAGENVGAYAIGPGTISAGGNYAISYTGADFTITPKALTVSGVAASNKIYDGTTAATLSTSGVTLAGLVGSDDVTLGASGAFQNANAGSGKTVTISNLSLGGAAAGNYLLAASGQQATTTADISAKTLTLAADANQGKIYGSADPALTYSVSGFVSGDTSSLLTGALNRAAGENVGAYTIGQGTISAGGNYAISYTGADFTITPKALTVVANAQSRMYGDANPAFTYTSDGLVNGDALTGALVTGATQASNVGTYDIGQGTLMASANYALTYQGASLTVTQRPLVLQANDIMKVARLVYAFKGTEFTSTGLVNGDLVTSVRLSSPGAAAGANLQNGAATPYAIDLSDETGSGLSNYSITRLQGVMTVVPMQAEAAWASTFSAPTPASNQGDQVASGASASAALPNRTPLFALSSLRVVNLFGSTRTVQGQNGSIRIQ